MWDYLVVQRSVVWSVTMERVVTRNVTVTRVGVALSVINYSVTIAVTVFAATVTTARVNVERDGMANTVV